MTAQALRVALVGLGGVAEAHLEAYKTVSGIEVVAGTDPDANRLHHMAGLYGFRAHATLDDMLENEKLDIVCVLSPVSTHADIATICAEAGKHILCEKPIANNIADAKRIIKACATNKVKLFYGASYRFLPTLKTARSLIQSEALGDILMLNEFSVGGTGPEQAKSLSPVHYPLGGPGGSGMGLVDHGIHLIDTFSWLLNSPIKHIYGCGNISGEPLAPEFMHMRFENQAQSFLLYSDTTFSAALPQEGVFGWGTGWTLEGPSQPGQWQNQPGSISVHGTKGALRIFHYANEIYHMTEAGVRRLKTADNPPPAQFALQMEAFRDNILNNQPPAVSGTDGLTALEALLQVYNRA